MNYEIISEDMLENDPIVDAFFDGDVTDLCSWSEGTGRGQYNYDLFKSGDNIMLRIQDCGEWYSDRFYFVTI